MYLFIEFVSGFSSLREKIKYNKFMFISGAILGVISGSCTLLILKFSSFTMDDLKEWQSQSQIERDLYV